MILLVVILVILIFCATYVYNHYPRKIESFVVNNQDMDNKVLIVSQGSEFKNALLNNLVTKIENDTTYIKVIHTSVLDEIDKSNWTSIIIINTCVADKINKNVNRFIQNKPNRIPIIMLITAGDGRWKPENLTVDAVSTASRMNRIETLTDSIAHFLVSKK